MWILFFETNRLCFLQYVIFVHMKGHTCKLFKGKLDDVQTKGNEEIDTA